MNDDKASNNNDFADWLGRTQVHVQHIDSLAASALAATLDLPRSYLHAELLPPGWQWLYFNPVVPRSQLGDDGHPRRDMEGSFLPLVPLPRRMWAGSRIRYLQPLRIGCETERHSRIARIAPKTGRAGHMCFVTVEHTTWANGRTCIVEEQDIVYREATTASSAPAARSQTTPEAPWPHERQVNIDATMLFRYSALTFNGHRIHYDLPYAREVEGYDGLVVHGPLTATLLQLFAGELAPGSLMRSFEFRGVSPLYVNEGLTLQGREEGQEYSMRALAEDGRVVMQATATWGDAS